MAKKDKIRLDLLLVERCLVPTRSKAQAYILAGQVMVNGERIDKAGFSVSHDSEVHLSVEETSWVSRGAKKLLQALRVFPVNPDNKVCVDIGASTGGFTDVLLSYGAKKVYAVDVGYGQLAWSLRTDSRVVVMERCNARYLKPDDIERDIDIITVDASFISLKLLLGVLENILSANGDIITLVKPQFEAGRERVGKGGVVRDPSTHVEILTEVERYIFENTGLQLWGAAYSPIKGPKGNIEFLFHLRKKGMEEGGDVPPKISLADLVSAAHLELHK